jgi:hypothetical protein
VQDDGDKPLVPIAYSAEFTVRPSTPVVCMVDRVVAGSVND